MVRGKTRSDARPLAAAGVANVGRGHGVRRCPRVAPTFGICATRLGPIIWLYELRKPCGSEGHGASGAAGAARHWGAHVQVTYRNYAAAAVQGPSRHASDCNACNGPNAGVACCRHTPRAWVGHERLHPATSHLNERHEVRRDAVHRLAEQPPLAGGHLCGQRRGRHGT